VTAPLVDYLIARRGLPPRAGRAYDYLLAGDGLYVVAGNDYLDVRVPVAPCAVRGLRPVHAACTLRHGRVPAWIWHRLVAEARVRAVTGHEVLLAVVHEPPYGYRLLRPTQVVGATRVLYRPSAATVLEVHSHHRMPAYFSRTDDADEQALRLYAVVGRLGAGRPEVALRVGAYGYFLPLPWESVFEGGRGVFRDVQFEADHAEEPGDIPD
jgi:PRTRC genetic system protein A